VIFGSITGIDPLSLGENEKVAIDPGFTAQQAQALQQIAHNQAAVPELSSMLLTASGIAGLVCGAALAPKPRPPRPDRSKVGVASLPRLASAETLIQQDGRG
jgi:hypothetical protein